MLVQKSLFHTLDKLYEYSFIRSQTEVEGRQVVIH